jgi:hypothetical protein
MTIPLRLGSRMQPAQGAISEYLWPTAEHPKSKSRLELSTAELAFRIITALKSRWSTRSTVFLTRR